MCYISIELPLKICSTLVWPKTRTMIWSFVWIVGNERVATFLDGIRDDAKADDDAQEVVDESNDNAPEEASDDEQVA